MAKRILELCVDHVGDPERVQQGVPAVEPDEAANVDAEASQRENGNDADPTHGDPADCRDSVCIRYSEKNPSNKAVQANAESMRPSYQSGVVGDS